MSTYIKSCQRFGQISKEADDPHLHKLTGWGCRGDSILEADGEKGLATPAMQRFGEQLGQGDLLRDAGDGQVGTRRPSSR